MILVVCAVAAELRGYMREGIDVVAVGVGPVEAAIGTVRALQAGHYALVINAGIGGGFADCARVGDAVAVTDERYVELGREDAGELRLPGGTLLETSISADAAMLERCRAAKSPVVFGRGVTSATITTTAARAASLVARFAPAVEAMEGFAVLRAAAAAGVPALEVRGISNIVGDRAASGWDFRAGSAAAVNALDALLAVVAGTQ
jgi:futalosine hydrolase